MRRTLLYSFLILINSGMAFTASQAIAQDRFANVEVTSKPIAGSVYLMQGAGGNIGVSAGPDGVLIVDDQYAGLAEKITAALKEINPSPVKYVINTHYHGDHTGGNAHMHTHHGATIFAHENVRVRLAGDDKVPAPALPVVTYEDGVKFHFNGDTIHVIHLPGGHTDGDSIVKFEKANVVHAGDLFFNGVFPYVDLGAGGNVDGYVKSVQYIIDNIADDTQVIAGHGRPMGNKKDLQAVIDMIKETKAIVVARKEQGMTAEQIVKEGLGDKWKDWSWRFITEERWINTLYQ